MARWLRLDSLLYGDNLRWISEAGRAAHGELIYRDFASMYPPLGVEFVALWQRWFGASFAVTLLAVDLLSIAFVLAVWRVARRLYSAPLAALCAAVVAATGAANDGNFALFSLALYTPSLLTGSTGVLLVVAGALDEVSEPPSWKSRALVVTGTTLALTSKLEHGAAALIALGVLALIRAPASGARAELGAWLVRSLGSFALALIPSALVYGVLAGAAGWNNLKEGLSGYGVASLSCPLWPTGRGAVIGLGALGQGIAAATLLAPLSAWSPRNGRRREFLLRFGALALGTLLWAVHLPLMLQGIWAPGSSWLKLVASYPFSMNGLLAPVAWGSLLLLVALLVRMVERRRRGEAVSPLHARLLVLLAPAAALSSRSLFSNLSGNPAVHQSSYALWFVLVPWLALLVQELSSAVASGKSFRELWRRPPEVAERPTLRALVLLGLGVVVVLGPRSAKALLGPPHPPPLETRAGAVFVEDPSSRLAYEFVERHTRPGDRIVEVPLGGGLAFAARLRPATHTMQFQGVMPEPRLIELDRARVVERPPALVVAADDPGWREEYGICCYCACSFPRLVWNSDTIGCKLDHRYVALDWLADRYVIAERFGMHMVLAPRDSELGQISKYRADLARRPRVSRPRECFVSNPG
ncbi:MAG TPA: hypothetical protein VGK73_08125 [Polyangiaceae bacterium]